MAEDPKEKQTRWLTEGLSPVDKALHLDRTRVLFPGQLEWYHASLSLEDPYFTGRIERDMLLMMSYKGRRSDDVVETLSHATDEESLDTGLQPVREYIRERRKRRRTEPE